MIGDGRGVMLAVLCSIVIAATLALLSRFPATPVRNPTADDATRLDEVERYIVESHNEWRRATMRYRVILGIVIACILIFMAQIQQQSGRLRDDTADRAHDDCLSSVEFRQQQRSRDTATVMRLSAARDLIADRPVPSADDFPNLASSPSKDLILYLIDYANQRRTEDLANATAAVEQARLIAAQYVNDFPIPDCTKFPG